MRRYDYAAYGKGTLYDRRYLCVAGRRKGRTDRRADVYDVTAWKKTSVAFYYLLTEISLYIRSKKGTCEVYAAPFGVFLKNEKGEDDYLEPDIVVVCDLDKLDEKGCHGAPDWVIEIVSPSSKKRDYLKKTAIYMEQGVREYWIVDPMREVTVVYKSEEEGFPVIHKFGEPIKVGIYEDFEITIK